MPARTVAIAAAVVLVIALAWLLGHHLPSPSLLSTPAQTQTQATRDMARSPTATTPRPKRDANDFAALWLSAPWGAGPGQLGRRSDPESVTVGPMAFVVGKSGAVVLDNVNRRLARFDARGNPLQPIALPTEAAQDVARAPRDGVAVLDRLHDKDLVVYNSDGSVRVTAPLAGSGITDPGGITGVFADRDGDLYVEREHGAWLRLVDAGGNLDGAHTAAPGRPTRDGRFVSAAIADRNAGTARIDMFDGDGTSAWTQTVSFGAPIMFIALLDDDATGDVFIAAHTGHESTQPPYLIHDETLTAIALSASGSELGRLSLPAPPPPEEAFRELFVGDDGTLYWMRRTTAGVQIEAYRLF